MNIVKTDIFVRMLIFKNLVAVEELKMERKAKNGESKLHSSTKESCLLS